MNTHRLRYVVLLLAVFGGLGRSAAPAAAQSSSLLGNPDRRRPLSLSNVSWTYQTPEPKREIHINDLITVNVNEMATVISGGSINQRLQGERNWDLKSWIIPTTSGLGVKADPQTGGAPNIDFLVNNSYQANADLQSKESVKCKLACHVVDIRPNGTLVLEGRRTIAVNEMNWEVSLVGSIRGGGRGAQQHRVQRERRRHAAGQTRDRPGPRRLSPRLVHAMAGHLQPVLEGLPYELPHRDSRPCPAALVGRRKSLRLTGPGPGGNLPVEHLPHQGTGGERAAGTGDRRRAERQRRRRQLPAHDPQPGHGHATDGRYLGQGRRAPNSRTRRTWPW